MGNKRKAERKLRTIEERKQVVRPIIEKLTELQLTIAYEPIRKLFMLIKAFLKEGNRYVVNIPFPMINKRIKGVLSHISSEEVWVKLEHEQFDNT